MPYRTQSEDTSPEIEKLLFEKLREVSPAQRLERALRFSHGALELSRQSVARRLPQAGERQARARWVEIHYGAKAARLIPGDEGEPGTSR